MTCGKRVTTPYPQFAGISLEQKTKVTVGWVKFGIFEILIRRPGRNEYGVNLHGSKPSPGEINGNLLGLFSLLLDAE